MIDSSPETPTGGARLAPRLVIGAVLTLQFVAAFKLLCPPKAFPSLERFRVVCSPKLWPFTDYQMYDASYRAPLEVSGHQVFAQLDDGRRVELTAEALDMDHDAFRWRFVDAVRRRRSERIDAGVRRFEERGGGAVTSLELVQRPLRLEEDGSITSLEERVVRTLDVSDSGSGR